MKYFFDTEFIEDDKTIDLLSIGIVAEDGREFYAENAEADRAQASDWVKQNVFPHLLWFQDDQSALFTRWAIKTNILQFCDKRDYGKPEFWAYYADYDWVVMCQLFGKMIDLPKGWPMYCRDIKQWCDMLGNPTLPPQTSVEHNALADARWVKTAWEFLNGQPK